MIPGGRSVPLDRWSRCIHPTSRRVARGDRSRFIPGSSRPPRAHRGASSTIGARPEPCGPLSDRDSQPPRTGRVDRDRAAARPADDVSATGPPRAQLAATPRTVRAATASRPGSRDAARRRGLTVLDRASRRRCDPISDACDPPLRKRRASPHDRPRGRSRSAVNSAQGHEKRPAHWPTGALRWQPGWR